LLRKLSEASGVSGYEHAVRNLVTAAFRPYADEVSVTAMGSTIALKRGTLGSKGKKTAPKVLIEGHMDEIGLMVTEIDRGFIRFTQVGGFDVRVLPYQEVLVHGKKALPGIIGTRVLTHLAEPDHPEVIPMDDLFIDLGLPEDQVRTLTQPGDLVTIARRMVTLKNSLVAGKAFDDRSAIVCVAEALRHLDTMRPAWDVYAVANVQEEVGLRGAMTSTFQIAPDVAIAIDVGHADQPNTSEINAVPLDEGMGIALGPNIHPLVHEKLAQIAKANEIPYQVTAYAGATGTNAWAMQVVREGIPTGLIDIPLRYMHTSVETISVADLERVGRLLANFCASLDDAFLRELRGEAAEEEVRPRRGAAGRRPRSTKRSTKK
jgi:endoglucanase